MYGKGSMMFPNGSTYTGGWKNGIQHGWGILANSDGSTQVSVVLGEEYPVGEEVKGRGKHEEEKNRVAAGSRDFDRCLAVAKRSLTAAKSPLVAAKSSLAAAEVSGLPGFFYVWDELIVTLDDFLHKSLDDYIHYLLS